MEKLLTLGIDPLAIVVYLTNAGLLLIVLTKFLYKPVLKIIDDRRDLISNSIDEAQKLKESYAKELKASEEQREAVEAALQEELANLKKFSEEKRAELIADMDKARSDLMQKAQDEIDQKKASLIKDAEKEIKVIMTKVILDIVQNKVPETVIQESVQEAWKQYK